MNSVLLVRFETVRPSHVLVRIQQMTSIPCEFIQA
jgi:hypothetical protein